MIWILILMTGILILACADFDKKDNEDSVIYFCNGKPYKKRK